MRLNWASGANMERDTGAMNPNRKRLESILIHTSTEHDDLPLSDYFRNGNQMNWIEVIVGWWAVIAMVVFSIWS